MNILVREGPFIEQKIKRRGPIMVTLLMASSKGDKKEKIYYDEFERAQYNDNATSLQSFIGQYC